MLDELGATMADRLKPAITNTQIITSVEPYQAQLLNKWRKGSLLVPGQTLGIIECSPAAYISIAANEAEKAAEQLAAKGITPTVADARFAKPLDKEMILRLARGHEVLITLEEGAVGGFGSHVAQLLAEEGAFDAGLKFRSMVLPDWFIDQGSPSEMYAEAGLEAADIVTKVLDVLGVAQVKGQRA